MKPSIKNLMTGLIDYAGLYPPANLDIKTTLANYGDYLAGEAGWMLGRCIVPVNLLHQVGLHPGFRYSVIISPALFDEELEQLSNFAKLHRRVEIVETLLPEGTDSSERCSDYLMHVMSKLNRAELQDVQLFIESGEHTPAALLTESLAAFNTRQDKAQVIRNAGFKLRCGGIHQQTFPPTEKVAEAIGICCKHNVPIKFTAGLHHPLRTYSLELEVMQHGFLNIFAAALLTWTGDLSTDERASCLNEEAASHFHFTKDGFSWREHVISAGEIKQLRQNKVISFGCCSFTEPIEGLRSLEILDNTGA